MTESRKCTGKDCQILIQEPSALCSDCDAREKTPSYKCKTCRTQVRNADTVCGECALRAAEAGGLRLEDVAAPLIDSAGQPVNPPPATVDTASLLADAEARAMALSYKVDYEVGRPKPSPPLETGRLVHQAVERSLSTPEPADVPEVWWFQDARVSPKDWSTSTGRPTADTAAVDHPAHYKSGGLEVIDIIEAFALDYNKGNAIKYILRAGRKSTDVKTDLRKAIWYLQRAIDRA